MAGFRFIKQWKQGGVVLRYFCPKGLPSIRIRGEPGTPEFEANYQRAFAVTTHEEMQALREEWGMIAQARRKYYDYERGDAIMAWANHQMMTMRQIELVQRTLGLSYEEATRNLPEGPGRALHQGPQSGMRNGRAADGCSTSAAMTAFAKSWRQG